LAERKVVSKEISKGRVLAAMWASQKAAWRAVLRGE
jgi:hypothetical protein